MRDRVEMIITDVDNTLYDWLSFYIPSFIAMVSEIHRLSGVAVVDIKQSFRRVHQAHQTTEYAFAIEELDVLNAIHPCLSVAERLAQYDSAIRAFRLERKRRLTPYSGVKETLELLKRKGIKVVAHSDSIMGYVSARLRQLGLDDFLDAIGAPQDHGIPSHLDPALVRTRPRSAVESRTRHIEISPHLRKPALATLVPIFEAMAIPPEATLYVGDSLSKDMRLAIDAGMRCAWARYGVSQQEDLYTELAEITYLSEAEMAEERRLRVEGIACASLSVIDHFSDLQSLLP